jgi:tetratricopeptide (TPR) repeat protein
MATLGLNYTGLFTKVSINLAQTYLLLNEINQAYEILLQIVQNEQRNTVYLAEAQACLANCYSKQNNLEDSFKAYISALMKYSAVKGESNEFCRVCNLNVGKILIKKKEFNQAQEYYEKSLEICRTLGRQNLIDSTQKELDKLKEFLQKKFL